METKMKLRLALRILWGLCCLLLLWVVVGDYIQFSKHPELYPIGCEGLSWSYESSENYTFTGWAAIGWNAIGFVASACYRFRHSGKILLVHFLLTLLLCCWNCMVIYG